MSEQQAAIVALRVRRQGLVSVSIYHGAVGYYVVAFDRRGEIHRFYS